MARKQREQSKLSTHVKRTTYQQLLFNNNNNNDTNNIVFRRRNNHLRSPEISFFEFQNPPDNNNNQHVNRSTRLFSFSKYTPSSAGASFSTSCNGSSDQYSRLRQKNTYSNSGSSILGFSLLESHGNGAAVAGGIITSDPNLKIGSFPNYSSKFNDGKGVKNDGGVYLLGEKKERNEQQQQQQEHQDDDDDEEEEEEEEEERERGAVPFIDFLGVGISS